MEGIITRKTGDRLVTAVTKADRAFGSEWKGADWESWINLIRDSLHS